MQFRALDIWPGTLTKNRRRAPFRAGWTRTLRDLDRETTHLHARNVILSAAFRPGQILQDGSRPNAGAAAAHPGVVISFEALIDGKYVPLKYPCDTFDDWKDNVRAISLALDALRRVDRYGVTKRAEQYRGWSQLPAPDGLVTPLPISVGQAAIFLAKFSDNNGRIEASREHFQSAYRVAAMKLHPDSNGGAIDDAWHMLQAAGDVLKKHHGIS